MAGPLLGFAHIRALFPSVAENSLSRFAPVSDIEGVAVFAFIRADGLGGWVVPSR